MVVIDIHFHIFNVDRSILDYGTNILDVGTSIKDDVSNILH